jgi:hypothetical protein
MEITKGKLVVAPWPRASAAHGLLVANMTLMVGNLDDDLPSL